MRCCNRKQKALELALSSVTLVEHPLDSKPKLRLKRLKDQTKQSNSTKAATAFYDLVYIHIFR